MRKVRGLWAVLAAVVLAGCAATGPKYGEVQGAIPTLAANKGRIYFYRDNSMFGAAIQPEIRLNGEVVGKSVPGGFFFIDRVPGSYEVVTSTEVENRNSVRLAAGDTRYIKTTISMGIMAGRVKPELVDPEQGRRDIMDLSYIGSPILQPAGQSAAQAPNTTPAVPSAPIPARTPAATPATTASAPAAGNRVMDDESGPLVVQKIEFRSGVSSATVERLAKRFGCMGGSGAGLITDKGPVEVYRMRCDNGTTFMARCELRQCRPLR